MAIFHQQTLSSNFEGLKRLARPDRPLSLSAAKVLLSIDLAPRGRRLLTAGLFKLKRYKGYSNRKVLRGTIGEKRA